MVFKSLLNFLPATRSRTLVKLYGLLEFVRHLLNGVCCLWKSNRMNFDFSAVYLIYDPKGNEVIYIGETNSLYSRITEHVKGLGRYSLVLKIKRRPEMSQKIEDYKIKYITVEDFRERKFSENLLLGIYKPKLNYTR